MASVAAFVRHALAYEARMWVSLFRWVLRRPVAGPGGTPFGYARTVTPVMLAFIGVSAVELPILHLLLPWPTIRLVADVLSAYGLIWMIGLLASVRVNPHVVSPAGLRVRAGGGVDLTVDWDDIAAIRVADRTVEGRSVKVADSALHLAVIKHTNVDITFRGPTILELPRGDTEPVRELRIAADEPAALVARAREFVPSPAPR